MSERDLFEAEDLTPEEARAVASSELRASLGWGALGIAVLIGSLLSSRAQDRYIRPAITFVIFASGLKYVGVPTYPLGFVMGMPFPTGLRALSAYGTSKFGERNASENSVEWAWAMNAAASVLGSVLAMVIAIQFGLTLTLACGAAAYLLALAMMPSLRSKTT